MKSILVIDDKQSIRFLYRKELEDNGYSVSVVATSEEAIEKLDKNIPDLIILDIKLSGIDYIDIMRKVKDQKGDIPIVLCSAYGRYKQDFKTWASDAYVVKSADLRELKLTIKEIFNQQKAD